jgi:hypothetical protein
MEIGPETILEEVISYMQRLGMTRNEAESVEREMLIKYKDFLIKKHNCFIRAEVSFLLHGDLSDILM